MKNKNNSEFIGFSPVVFDDSEILILGSFPSVKSRKNNFYYGNPQNRFWKTVADVFNQPMPETIDEKVEYCRKNKIALWDIIQISNLKGSSDSSLVNSDYEISDISRLLKKYPKIKKILCNGKTAYDLFIKNFDINIEVIKLPSTSPANVRFNVEEWEKAFKK